MDKVHIEEHELMDLKKIEPSQRPEMLNAIVKEIQGLLDLQTFSRNHFPEVIGHLTLELCSRSNTAQMVPRQIKGKTCGKRSSS